MSKPEKRLYEFGPFRLDAHERLLWRNDEPVLLTPKAFDTLLALVEKPGHVIEKDDLMRAVWPDTFIEENTLASNISTLRKALGQTNGDEYIQTVPRRGYRFVASVSESLPEEGALLIHRQTRTHTVIEEQQTTRRLSLARLTASLRPYRTTLVLSALVVVSSAVFYLWIAGHAKPARAERQSRAPVDHQANQNEAYATYLEGRDLWNKRTAAGLFQSIAKFEQAVEKDPDFALAYDGLADAYAFDYIHWRQAEALVGKALDLDNGLAEAHATLGFIRLFWQWNWRDAEQEFQQSIKLNPSYATAHQWYAICLAVTGRLPEAEVEIRRAVELEPLSPVMNADLGQILYFDYRFDEAIAACQKALDIDADFYNAHEYLFEIYLQKQMADQAVDEFFKLGRVPGAAGDHLADDNLRTAFAARGIRGFWRARLADLLANKADPYEIALCYARLGKREQTLDWLERACEQHSFEVIYFWPHPAFHDIRWDPRLTNISERMGTATLRLGLTQ